MVWKFWKRQSKPDVQNTASIHRKENNDLKEGWLQVNNDPVNPKKYDLVEHVLGKPNLNVLIVGSTRSGKTTLGEYLCLKIPARKIGISFKRFHPTKRDFDIGYKWIDITSHVPNLFADKQSFIEAFRTAFFADANSRGLAIDTILTKVGDIMQAEPKNFVEFYVILDRLAGRGQWEENLKNIIRSKVQLLERATAGAKHGSIDFSKGNIILDLGNLPDDESKTFLAEYYLRQINRIEEQAQREEQIYIVCDEIWHLLRYKAQNSIVGTILLQGAYYIHFLCITQNYTHLDEEYRSQFGTIFCFRDTNDADVVAVKDGYGELVREAIQKLDEGKRQFIDLKYLHEENDIPVFVLNYEKLKVLKLQAKTLAVLQEPDESFVQEEPQIEKVEEKQEENLEEKAVKVLQSSDVCLHGYGLAKSSGVSPEDVNSRRRIVRKLLADGKIKDWECQVRREGKTYYYLTNDGRDPCHNFMMQETKKKFDSWNIVFEAIHGTQGVDFVIEKNGRKLSFECETGLKNDISDLQDRVAKNQTENIPTIIVVPTNDKKIFYQHLFDCKVCLIPEIEEALKD